VSVNLGSVKVILVVGTRVRWQCDLSEIEYIFAVGKGVICERDLSECENDPSEVKRICVLENE
jgi:hypothetical protein